MRRNIRRYALALALPLLVAGCGGESPLASLGRSGAEPERPVVPAASTTAAGPAPAPNASSAPPAAAPPPVSPPLAPPWQTMLDDGIESFDNGAYGNAIRKLAEVANNPQAEDATRVKALKYLAFSYCVSPDSAKGKSMNHLALCRQAFERALAIDPSFELAAGERGHPVWGRQFVAAKSGKAKKALGPATSGDGKASQAALAPKAVPAGALDGTLGSAQGE